MEQTHRCTMGIHVPLAVHVAASLRRGEGSPPHNVTPETSNGLGGNWPWLFSGCVRRKANHRKGDSYTVVESMSSGAACSSPSSITNMGLPARHPASVSSSVDPR